MAKSNVLGESVKRQASQMMRERGLVQVWHCPVSGQWFTTSALAEGYEKKSKNKLNLIENECS